MTAAPFALEMAGVSRRFGAVLALDDVSLQVRRGSVHALLGENGAGKTTLMHVAYGMVRADSGTIRVGPNPARILSPADAIALGIGMVHQHFTLVPAMTVAENIALGGRGLLGRDAMIEQVRELSARTGFALDAMARVDSLPVGAQQRVEIAKALVRGASLLVLDEPTAVLAPAEVEELLAWLRAYASRGNAAVLITHKLREALTVADDVTVLRRGRVALSVSAEGTTKDELTKAMIGETTLDSTTTTGRAFVPGTVVFAASGMSVASADGVVRIREASFSIRSGEFVGVVGVEGSGQHELLRALAGRLPIVGGTLECADVVGFVPEDRHRDAVLLDRSLAQTIALRGAGSRTGVMHWEAIHARTAELLEAFDVRAPSTETPVRALSGGNQQKLVLAREMSALSDAPAPIAIVVENPTRGLDVRASAAVHQRLQDACVHGAAVVMYSSDLDEVLALASRVLVVFAGVVRETAVSREAIAGALLGVV